MKIESPGMPITLLTRAFFSGPGSVKVIMSPRFGSANSTNWLSANGRVILLLLNYIFAPLFFMVLENSLNTIPFSIFLPETSALASTSLPPGS